MKIKKLLIKVMRKHIELPVLTALALPASALIATGQPEIGGVLLGAPIAASIGLGMAWTAEKIEVMIGCK
jgi:hypothetical protein